MTIPDQPDPVVQRRSPTEPSDPSPTEPTEVIPVPVPATAAEILQSTPPSGFPGNDNGTNNGNGDHLDRQLAEMVSRSRRYLWLVIATLALLVLGLTGAVVYLIVNNQNAAQQNAEAIAAAQVASDHRWCATFDLLTRTRVDAPPHPGDNPSRAANYQLYTDFVTLKNQFHCS